MRFFLALLLFVLTIEVITLNPVGHPQEHKQEGVQSQHSNAGGNALIAPVLIAPEAASHKDKGAASYSEQHGQASENRSPFGRWLKDAHHEILSVFTILIALATIGLALYTYKLWRATGKLVEEANASSERGLRAYLMVDKCEFIAKKSPQGLHEDWIHINVKNFGQTPATKISYWIELHAKKPLWADKATKAEKTRVATLGAIGANGDFTTRIELTLLEDGGDEIHSGINALYVVGAIEYFDVFNKRRTADFRYMRSGEYWTSEGELDICEHGNDIT